ncbi:MAG: tetratricopeptide repeat protein [Candidatus Electryonea clarkiae]|nr:tetratricopeptide repeat protein [Candidatus Electryonea clarkiae]MDP8287350.1 tetratricopeptide repeat protein [Candidatus Electryonea clarkiae]
MKRSILFLFILCLSQSVLAGNIADSIKTVGRIKLKCIAGQQALFDRHYIQALMYYQEALTIGEEKFGKSSIHIIKPIAMIATVYDKQRKYRDAVIICDRLIPLLKMHYGKSDPEVVETWVLSRNRLKKLAGID